MQAIKTNSGNALVLRGISLIALAALAAAGYFSIRLAAADWEFRRQTPESVARAIAIEPGNTEYLLFRALQVEYEGGDATPLLERAAELNPMSSAPRIRLGLNAEIRGDYASSEKWLIDAAKIDRQFEPRWTLANFYFRRDKADQFWPAIHDALEISYGDRRPAFDLCWHMSSDPNLILERALPDRRDVLMSYVIYLLDAHKEAVAPAAIRLAQFHRDRDVLLAAVDSLIASNEASDARRVWAAMGFESNSIVFNDDFRAGPMNRGFDWRESDFIGLTFTNVEEPAAALRIAFDGRQPESCELLSQTVNLEPRASYVLRWKAQQSGLKSPSGIEWTIAGKRAPVDATELTFTAAKNLEPLALLYQRPKGETRAEGYLELSRISIEKLR